MSVLTPDRGFVEVADRCWVARFGFLDVNAGVIAGERGLALVDTLASDAEARRLVEEVRRLGAGDVVAVVNTHVHFDHVLGNTVVSQEYAAPPVVAHEDAAAELEEHVAHARSEARSRPDDERWAAVAATEPLRPTETFSSAKVIDLGDRLVEVVHPGRGHTAGDAVVRVADADLLFAGDLVEESGMPALGDDSYPLEWPTSLDFVQGMLGASTVVVPGHGDVVDRDFVADQMASLAVVAETIRDLAGRGVPPDQALAAADWPYPREELAHAVTRGYAQLPRGGRRLPLA